MRSVHTRGPFPETSSDYPTQKSGPATRFTNQERLLPHFFTLARNTLTARAPFFDPGEWEKHPAQRPRRLEKPPDAGAFWTLARTGQEPEDGSKRSGQLSPFVAPAALATRDRWPVCARGNTEPVKAKSSWRTRCARARRARSATSAACSCSGSWLTPGAARIEPIADSSNAARAQSSPVDFRHGRPASKLGP